MSTSKDLLKKLKKFYERMESEKLSSKDIDQMVDLSKDLYERCVILRYKTIEQKVFDKADKKVEEPEMIADNTVEAVTAEPTDEVVAEPAPEPISYSIEDEGLAEDLELDEDLLEVESDDEEEEED
ncbi:unnamed protein product, partial [Chrysoparadoxa australica]